MLIHIETEELPERGLLQISLDIRANINITADEARRKVSVYAGNEIGDLLSGETPDLVCYKNCAYWRVPVVLTSRALGCIGFVGFVDVNVESGEMQLTEQDVQELEDNARRLSGGSMTVSVSPYTSL
jgi:hypothetical protein